MYSPTHHRSSLFVYGHVQTAAQLGSLCQLALDEFMETESDVELSKLRDLAQKDPEALEKSILKVNGVGHLAVDVFERRVQARWSELYPFAGQLVPFL